MEIEWLNVDGSKLTDISDRIKVSQIHQINGSIFARDVIFSPLRHKDNGTVLICGARVEGKFIISHSAYESTEITVISKYYKASGSIV